MGIGSGNKFGSTWFVVVAVIVLIAVIGYVRWDNNAGAPSLTFNNGGNQSMNPADSNSYSQNILGLFGGGSVSQNGDNQGQAVNNSGAGQVSETDSEGVKVTAYFCPQDACADKLITQIDGAQKTLHIAIYSFTHDEIADAVIKAKERGVEVKVIFDYDQSNNSSSDDEKLSDAGVNITRRKSPGYMHNKFAIIDGRIVSTGSFNYSQNADTRNEENLVFISDAGVADRFERDFNLLWDLATEDS